jgi:hypothetical protein
VSPVVQGLAGPTPRCSDGHDNDGDARTDFPADSGCSSAADDDEAGAPVSQLVPSSATPRLLLPFPIVRVRGIRQGGRVRIRLLSVRAPSGSRVTVFCDGAGCPERRERFLVGTRTVRVRAFERTVRPVIVLRVYVTKPGFVGKYTRFRFRRGGLPLRTDGCASIAGRSRPCPAA